jgi:glyoxylase-like metal-dependent hydrolase (beta-lactamase superfamily II)
MLQNASHQEPPMITEFSIATRRSFIAVASMATTAALLQPRRLFADELGIVPTMVNAAASAKITMSPLRRNINVIEGSGGNIAVLTGKDGKLLVDAGFAVSRMGILDALASISRDPITHLIDSHWHIDHTDGNAWLHDAGATIIAQEKTREHLSVMTRVDGWDYNFQSVPYGALPTTVFDEDHKMQFNNTSIILKHYAPAHTDSDISVHFTDADVLHVADTWWNGVYPFIDYSTGGSINGSIRAAEDNVSMVTDKTIVIPGHGPVGGKSGLIEFRDMLIAIRDNVATLKKQGKTLDETIAAKPTEAFDAKWGQFLVSPALFTGLVYRGV